MKPSDDTESEIAGYLATIAPGGQPRPEASATIARSLGRLDSQGKRALAVVERLAYATNKHELKLEETIGEGGMGIVRLATQVALHRKVAVKTLRSNKKSDTTTVELLREAWVTGGLEHPNVVPVYFIGFDGDSPYIVMKRIEGVGWNELIDDAEAVQERFGTDLLAWNLRILQEVMDAVRFAHSRHIIHRDLKPENVMIGEFGEVYVVDWGIAVSLIDDGTNRLALARDVTEVVGTLGYMSTEMLRLNVPLTERTDVYLLGAILHEILSGRSPHAGSDIHEVIASIIASKPALPKDAPTELAEICRRAMAVAPEDRFETVDAMQHAISEFINHRGSTRLSGHALDRLTELESELAGAHEADEDKRQRIYHLFGECRFGFREAIIAWPGNEDAKSGRRRALCGMAEYELSHGDPRAARTLVREIDEPPAELANRIDEALDALDRDKERIEQLEKLGKDLDPMIGRRTRLAIGPGFAMTSLVATAVPLFFDQNFYVDSHGHIVTAVGGLVVLFTAAGVWARDSMMKTRLNRGVYSSLLMCLIAELILEVALMFKDIPAANTLFVHPLMWAVTAGFASIAFDRRLVPTAMAFLAACLLTVASPVHGHFGVMAASVLFIVNAFVIWGRPKDEPPKEANVS